MNNFCGVLHQTQEGKELIRLYYRWSPAIVKAMEEDEEFKDQIKEMVEEILSMVGRERFTLPEPE